MTIAHLSGLAASADRYRGFVIDLWGVIHDGVTPYEDAIGCLRRLRQRGARIVLLSNAPRRAHAARAALERMGIPAGLYDAVVTSGEAAWLALGEMPGVRVYHLGPERDRNVMEGRDLVRVESAEAADLLLNTGPDDLRDPTSLDAFLPDLVRCLGAGLPMLCANPDLEIVSRGRRLLCAGALARWYADQGGRVRWIGKPEPDVYALVWPHLDGIARAETLAVGDALRTDIAGAKAVGIDSCWILGGIHAFETPADAEREALGADLSPVATLPRLRW